MWPLKSIEPESVVVYRSTWSAAAWTASISALATSHFSSAVRRPCPNGCCSGAWTSIERDVLVRRRPACKHAPVLQTKNKAYGCALPLVSRLGHHRKPWFLFEYFERV